MMELLILIFASMPAFAQLAQVDEFTLDIKEIKSSRYRSECIKATQPLPDEDFTGPFTVIATIDLIKNDDSVISYNPGYLWFWNSETSASFESCEKYRKDHNGLARTSGGLDEQELLKKIKLEQNKVFKTTDQKICYQKNVAFIKRGNEYSYHPVTMAMPITVVETKEKVDCETSGTVTQIPGEMIIKTGTYHSSNGCSLNIAHNTQTKEIIVNVFEDKKCNISEKNYSFRQKSPESPNEYLNRDKDTLTIISPDSFIFLGTVFVEKLFESKPSVVINTQVSHPQTHRTTYRKCFINSYDACPSAAQWSCKRYGVYGMNHDFWVTTIKKGLFQNKAYEMLSNLRGAGLCP